MAEFTSWQSFYDFSRSVTRKWRYARDEQSGAFLDAVVSTCHSRIEEVPPGSTLWRARTGCGWRLESYGDGEGAEVPAPLTAAEMKPLPDLAPEGRANPKGIPYLYAASDKETAVAETRPWVGAYVTVSALTVQRLLRIVNCIASDPETPFVYFEEPTESEKEASNWDAIDMAFSRPVTPNDRSADYAATQIVAEEFRKNGFDGIAYRSSVGPGRNVAIFDVNAAEVSASHVCSIRSLSVQTRDVTVAYPQ